MKTYSIYLPNSRCHTLEHETEKPLTAKEIAVELFKIGYNPFELINCEYRLYEWEDVEQTGAIWIPCDEVRRELCKLIAEAE